uniref:Winged helix Storkhead-box1 domain-containing protein n=1 Tax=Strigamia maritima TaxID=126957 RepID=T1IUP5_STRMM
MSTTTLNDEDQHRKSVMYSQKCLGIVLKRIEEHISCQGNECKLKNGVNVVATTSDSNAEDWMLQSGFLIFVEFQEQNRQCFWNPTLVDSVNHVEYMGFIAPGMLLIGGNEFYLEGLRSSWTRRVLKPPINYVITRLGDVGGLDIQVISQTQFTPLPEALCLVVSELNHLEDTASLQMICAQLHERFNDMIIPNEDIIYSTLGKLIKERKIYHTGDGYFVVTPKTYRLTTLSSLPERQFLMSNEEALVKLHGKHLNSPKPTTPSLRSRSIQANMGEMSTPNGRNDKSPTKSSNSLTRMERFGSMRLSRKEKCKSEDENTFLRRRASLRFSPERSTSLIKDINLKTSPAHQHADKGEKVSVFQRLFRRSSSNRRKERKSPVELATFSAQFPPPEWTNLSCVHYQSQATQTLEHRGLKDKTVSTNSLKKVPVADFYYSALHFSRTMINLDDLLLPCACDCDDQFNRLNSKADTLIQRTKTPRSHSTEREKHSASKISVAPSNSKASARAAKPFSSTTTLEKSPKKKNNSSTIAQRQLTPKLSERRQKEKNANKSAPKEVVPSKPPSKPAEEDPKPLGSPPTTRVAPYRILAPTTPMNNTTSNNLTSANSNPKATIVNKLSPKDEKDDLELDKTPTQQSTTLSSNSPTSGSEFEVAFSSLAAKKILQGISMQSIDTLVE